MRKHQYLLLLLLALDVGFFVLHVIIELPLYTNAPVLLNIERRGLFLITVDHSLPEWYQYIKFLILLVLINRLLKQTNSRGLAAWYFAFALMLLDDALKIHEQSGRLLASIFNFVAPFNLRLQDIGELITSALLGLAVFGVLLWVAARAQDRQIRERTLDIIVLVAFLALFGIVIDFFGPVRQSPLYRVSIGTLEDIGEMLVLSVIVYYVYRLAIGDPPRLLYRRLPFGERLAGPVLNRPAASAAAWHKLTGYITGHATLFALLFYAVYIVIITWPVLGRLGSHIPGDGGDAYVHLWNFEHVLEAITTSSQLFYTGEIFFPDGVYLYTHNFAWLNIVVWLPLQMLIGSATAYSLLFVSVYWLNAIAAFYLLRELTGENGPAFVGGLIVGGWQYLLMQSTRPNLILITFIPLAMWALLKLARTGERRYFWLSAIYIGAIGVARIQLFALSLLLLIPFTLRCLLQTPAAERMRLLWRYAAAYLLGGLPMILVVAPILWYQLTRDFPQDIFEVSRTTYVDLTSFFLPYWHHPLLTAPAVPDTFLRFNYFFGLVPLLLLIGGLLQRGRGRLFWLLLLLVTFALGVGDRLQIAGEIVTDMPFVWFKDTYIDDFIGSPSRFNTLLPIPFAVLAAFGVQRLLAWSAAPLRLLTLALVAFVIVAEYRVPYNTVPLAAPAWYSQLAGEPGDFGILSLPHARRYAETYMNYQRYHGKGIIGGHVSRTPREATRYINAVPLLSYLESNYVFAQQTLAPALDNISEQLQQLATVDIRYVVIHKQMMEAEATASWRKWLAVPPIYEDDEVLVYTTQPTQTGRPIAGGVGQIQTVVETPGKRSQQTIEFTSHWMVEPTATLPDELCLSVDSYEPTCQPFALPPLTDDARQLVRNRQRVQLNKRVAAGPATVRAQLFAGGQPVAPPFDFAEVDVAGPTRVFDMPQPDQPLDVVFVQQIALLGFDQPQIAQDKLRLTVYWQALVDNAQPAKYFVHVVNANGEVVAQADAVPRNWAYPINEWAAEEVVADTIEIDVAAAPVGDYTVRIGLVDLVTLERLPVANDDGRAVDQSVQLITVDIP